MNYQGERSRWIAFDETEGNMSPALARRASATLAPPDGVSELLDFSRRKCPWTIADARTIL